MKPDTTREVTVMIRKPRRLALPPRPSTRFEIEIPADLLDDFGLPKGSTRVIRCRRAA